MYIHLRSMYNQPPTQSITYKIIYWHGCSFDIPAQHAAIMIGNLIRILTKMSKSTGTGTSSSNGDKISGNFWQ